MSYMGTAPNYGNPKKFTSTGDGVEDTFVVGWTIGSVNSLYVFVNGLITTAFTASNDTIVFSAPPANLASILVLSIVPHNSIVVPADDSVTAAKLASDVNTRFSDIETDVTTNTNSINALAASRVKQYFFAGF